MNRATGTDRTMKTVADYRDRAARLATAEDGAIGRRVAVVRPMIRDVRHPVEVAWMTDDPAPEAES